MLSWLLRDDQLHPADACLDSVFRFGHQLRGAFLEHIQVVRRPRWQGGHVATKDNAAERVLQLHLQLYRHLGAGLQDAFVAIVDECDLQDRLKAMRDQFARRRHELALSARRHRDRPGSSRSHRACACIPRSTDPQGLGSLLSRLPSALPKRSRTSSAEFGAI